MHLLAFDCASSSCSVAVFRDGEPVASLHEEMTRGQAERLVPMIGEVLAEAGLRPENLNRLAVTVGPGAFTGIRIGLAAARAMALSLDLPLTGVTTFEATLGACLETDPANDGRPVAVILETGRGDFYCQLFSPGGQSMTAGAALDGSGIDAVIASHASAGCRLIGDGAHRYAAVATGTNSTLSPAPPVPFTALDVARCAMRKQPDARPPRPLYLRPPGVTPKPLS